MRRWSDSVRRRPGARALAAVVAAERRAVGAVTLERCVALDTAERCDDLVDGHLPFDRFVAAASRCEHFEHAVELLGEHPVNFVSAAADPSTPDEIVVHHDASTLGS
jgi:hypothetical protein